MPLCLIRYQTACQDACAAIPRFPKALRGKAAVKLRAAHHIEALLIYRDFFRD
jgi:hypothetical protein